MEGDRVLLRPWRAAWSGALAVLGLLTPPVRAQEAGGEVRTPLPEGVTAEVELVIERGLQFLVKRQRPDGSWVSEEGSYPVAMTALAGVALLSSGSTATRGPYSSSIRRAAGYILKSQSRSPATPGLFSTVYDNDGLLDVDERRPMYGHAFSLMFLAQVLGGEESLERQEEIRVALRKAVDLTIRSQSDRGGWYYYPNDRSDEGTLTVTMMQGLRASKDAGIHVPREVIDQGLRYIEASVNPDGGVRYRSTARRDSVREGVTCASVVALWSAGRYEDDPLLRKIRDYMERNITPQWNTYENHATYVQFYLAQAKFLLGGNRWRDFYRTESRLLLGDQEADGSWLTQEERRQHGVGAVYSTSIALIVLQLPYNRLPVFQR